MSSDIEKLAVMDSRIVQHRPKYAVEKGALSLTNAPFSAISQSSSQHTYNIYVPSENVFVDRKLQWSSTCYLAITAQCIIPDGTADGDSLIVPGRDIALAPLPLNQLCSTLSATINDTTAVINSQDVLNPVLRLTDYKKNRLIRTCPTMLDKYQSYDDAYGTLNNPIGGEESGTDYDNVQNGAYPGLVFTDPTGNPLPAVPAGGAGTVAYAGATYSCSQGIPTFVDALAPAPAVGSVYTYTFYVSFRSTEPIVLSPFIFADEHEWDTGLFGINNIQLIMNLLSSPSRVLRNATRSGVKLTSVGYNSGATGGVFQNSFVNTLFLTPSLDVPLPPKSVVPYMEFPRYITSFNVQQQIAPGTAGTLQSQTITLPQIPDLLIIYAKSNLPAYSGNKYGDFYFPLASRISGGVANPLTVNFDNFSGLLSSTTTEQLYGMSVKNGLDMDYASFLGQAHSASASWSSDGATFQQGAKVSTVGSVLVLKPSQDITLQSGQAPSLVGNFTLQFNIQVFNNTPDVQQPVLYVITANSGFFESIRGSSRIIKGVLSEQDIIGAPLAPMMTRSELDRMVGGFSFGSLGNILSKVASHPATGALGKVAMEHGPGLLKSALGMGTGGMGAGTGGMGAGTGGVGAGTGGRRKSLASRLM
jgi:hypothetical protein